MTARELFTIAMAGTDNRAPTGSRWNGNIGTQRIARAPLHVPGLNGISVRA